LLVWPHSVIGGLTATGVSNNLGREWHFG